MNADLKLLLNLILHTDVQDKQLTIEWVHDKDVIVLINILRRPHKTTHQQNLVSFYLNYVVLIEANRELNIVGVHGLAIVDVNGL